MYVDSQTLVSGSINSSNVLSGQNITGTGQLQSNNAIDLTRPRNIALGTTLYMNWQVQEAVVGATNVEVQIIAADNSALTTNVQVLGSTGNIAVAGLTPGVRGSLAASVRTADIGRRYVGARYAISGTATAGRILAHINHEATDGLVHYPAGAQIL